MRPKHFTLTAVEAMPESTLVLHYADGAVLAVMLTALIERHKSLARLKDPKVFAQAQVGDFGASVVWADDDDLELAADNLRARAVEQAGGISHEFIVNWMAMSSLSVAEAARALGLSPRMVAYYRSGEKPVPRHVALACIGWADALEGVGASNDSRFSIDVAV